MVMRVGSFVPFQATYYLNGHSFIEQELNRTGVGFRKNDNAFLAVEDPAALQAVADPQCLNVHVDFPLLQRLALPITLGSATYPGIKIHDTRMIRLMQVLLHARTTVGGWRAQQLHDALLMSFGLSGKRYGLSQLRYDLRKMRAHALLERDGTRYAYRLTDKGGESRAAIRALSPATMWPAG